MEEFRDKDVVILGDSRMDSPGHCAQYCTYTIMENESKKILCILTMDKRMTGKNSCTLEKSLLPERFTVPLTERDTWCRGCH